MLKITAVALALGSAYATPIASSTPIVDVDDEIEIVPFDAERRLDYESAMAKLRQMKAVHRGAKARCKATGNEKACAKQARLEESMIALSGKWREPARDGAGRRLESEEDKRAEAMEKLQRMKRQHKKVKAECLQQGFKETGDQDACDKQQRLEESMIKLSAKWREPARDEPADEPVDDEPEVAVETESDKQAAAMERLRKMKEAHKKAKAKCQRTGDADQCAKQQRLEASMLDLSAKYREPAREGTSVSDTIVHVPQESSEEPEAPKSEEEQREEAMERLRQLKEQHKRVKAACQRSGDETTCLLQAHLEDAMIELSGKWREPAREQPESEEPQSEEDERAEAMEQLRQMKADHKEVKADCLATGDALACAEQDRLEEAMIALSGKWREPARERPQTEEPQSEDDERAEAMQTLREMKAAHKEVKDLCLETRDEDACDEQQELEAEMIRLSGIWREPARDAGRRLEESAKKAEKRAAALEKLRKMKATHKIVKAACKKTGKEKVCAKQQRLEEKMIALSAKWREGSRN